ncbi:MAG TPA: GNAT family acetyltransferase [Azospirillaceae bacterium]|nr:GNAT family acetyltransferase [Azospirillaceae bacterium]
MSASSFTVRAYRDGDRDPVVALWSACNLLVPWNDPVADIELCRANTNSLLLIGQEDGSVVASTMVGHDGHRGWLYYVAVDPERRRRGYGRRMVKAAEGWLAERNLPKAQLMVRSTNTTVAEFYRRLGYETGALVVMQHWLIDPPAKVS